jgi:lipopolysaccharide export LptBFGC system permease protein LptF
VSEKTAFILFGIAIAVLTGAWMAGLKVLGAGEELRAVASLLMLPVAGFGGSWIFMRYH